MKVMTNDDTKMKDEKEAKRWQQQSIINLKSLKYSVIITCILSFWLCIIGFSIFFLKFNYKKKLFIWSLKTKLLRASTFRNKKCQLLSVPHVTLSSIGLHSIPLQSSSFLVSSFFHPILKLNNVSHFSLSQIYILSSFMTWRVTTLLNRHHHMS